MKRKKISRKFNPPKKFTEEFVRRVMSGEIEGSYSMPENPTHVERVKYGLCKNMVHYLITHEISQRDLAKILGADEARVSEAVHYKIWLLSADQLIAWNEKLYPKTKSIELCFLGRPSS